MAGLADLTQDDVHLFHVAHHPVDQRARFFHQVHAVLGLTGGALNKLTDFAGRRRALLGKLAHLTGHHRKATTVLTGARCFHGRVQRQNVGLESNGVDQVDNVGHPVRRLVNQAHFAGHLLHHLTVVFDHRGSICREVGRFASVRGGVFHRRGDLLHRGCCLFNGTCLLFRARGEILVTRNDLRGCAGDILRAGLHLLHNVQQTVFHLHQRMQQ